MEVTVISDFVKDGFWWWIWHYFIPNHYMDMRLWWWNYQTARGN